MVKPCKRIWELQSSTVCKVVGMGLLLKDLQRIARKFGISVSDPLLDEEFALHTTMVQLCSRDNPVSRFTEKLIEKRFLIHGKKVPLEDPIRTIERVQENPQDVRAPLWAILWGLATRGRLADAKIEAALFGCIHMMEHRLLRDHWRSLHSGADEAGREMGKDGEILSLKRELLDMQWANRKLEKIIEGMRNQIESAASAQRFPVNVADSGLSSAKCLQCPKNRKIQDLKALLAQTKYCNCELEDENAQLREEIAGLLEELNRYEDVLADKPSSVSDGACPFARNLKGKKVTLVGGIESLECWYRQLIESAGGQFRRHDGSCGGGEQALEDCISGSDLVVCPVEVNSHNAAQSVKRICKARGVRCCFPRSASLSGLRKALQEHCAELQVA